MEISNSRIGLKDRFFIAKKKFKTFFSFLDFEALIWFFGLLALVFINPIESHFTICPFSLIGIEYCPGCGLGRSIHFLFEGNLQQSLNTHPLGWLAFLILTIRIIKLMKTRINYYLQMKS
ncbi:MAG: DUF2752 domain-containing protein [Ignavibacteriaceae bacterium]|nr:DUF2752 domain-containing protein [Ignavibacteriaceae bacterium]